MKRFLTLVLLITLFSNYSFGQEKKTSALKYNGFSGGMMLHTGFVSSNSYHLTSGNISNNVKIKGMPTGIGGAIKINFGKHLRIGTEGYSSSIKYSNDSFSNIGWGGLLADLKWKIKRFNPFFGATIGGGVVKNLTILEELDLDYIIEDSNVSYRHYGFVALAPFCGVEYSLTERINIIFKVDYLMNINNPQDDFVKGPRIYAGFMFCH